MKKRTLAIICMSLLSIGLGFLTFIVVSQSLYNPFVSHNDLTDSSQVKPEKLFLNSVGDFLI